ncbi:NAD(P)/FAD-dependent oxidoreductase [Hydromonas duriensis]|uniref:Glycine/D-amino acid oxidase-like deaminating enzyme n=1 Tax=Hydromonas duriensis TaxID=1527608 RepID=A0A4R6Y787_9BURK|nr:FAD-binding oxidoreductase [Hydromonas duriensis]TDR31177.1 glycine/D-amino acid oxidase-like deaminating enzyme [Hydromonas duriensis]
MNNQRLPSYYTASLGHDTYYPELSQHVHVDVAIIGGGFTGLNTALELAEQGKKVALIESKKIGWGQSGRNGGQVTGSLSGEGAMRRQLQKRMSPAEADDFIWFLRWHGHDVIQNRVRRYGIDCDLKYGHLHTAYKRSHLKELQAEYELAQQRGLHDAVQLIEHKDMGAFINTPLYFGGLYNKKNMHLHPLKLCVGEAKALEQLGGLIFEHTKAERIIHGKQPQIHTAKGKITAEHIMIAGDVYHKLEQHKLGGLIFPAAGGIVTTAPLGALAYDILPKDVAVYDCRFVLDYYRLTADGRLLFGGGANYSGKESRDIAAELRPHIERTFPQLKGIDIEHQWSCNMGIVINRVPQLGKLSENVWYAQGYSGHGVATSHVVGEVMAKAISGQMDRFNTFNQFKHIKVPLGDWLGNQMLALGMHYYLFMERFH